MGCHLLAHPGHIFFVLFVTPSNMAYACEMPLFCRFLMRHWHVSILLEQTVCGCCMATALHTGKVKLLALFTPSDIFWTYNNIRCIWQGISQSLLGLGNTKSRLWIIISFSMIEEAHYFGKKSMVSMCSIFDPICPNLFCIRSYWFELLFSA